MFAEYFLFHNYDVRHYGLTASKSAFYPSCRKLSRVHIENSDRLPSPDPFF